MATITLRVEDHTRDDLEQLARTRQTSVSELLRGAIADLLGTRRELASEQSPRSMSMVDRRTLALLHGILDRLDQDGDTGEHKRQIDALERGFTDEYAYEFGALEPELSLAECTLVHDILEMFVVLQSSLGKLSQSVQDELGADIRHAVTFAGFDMSDSRETRLLSYAKHLIATDRYDYLKSHFDGKHEHGNSHMAMLGLYQRVLQAYREVLERKKGSSGFLGIEDYRFSAEDLRQVGTAAYLR